MVGEKVCEFADFYCDLVIDDGCAIVPRHLIEGVLEVLDSLDIKVEVTGLAYFRVVRSDPRKDVW